MTTVMRTEVAPVASHSHGRETRGTRLQEFLRGRRLHIGLSQVDVASILNISTRAYGNWERGVVKEWTDEKLCALSRALNMTAYQKARLFWLAVGRAPAPAAHPVRAVAAPDPETAAFLKDYSLMINAISLPTFVIDHRWDVTMVNNAYQELFSDVCPHPTAMPTQNFLRFGLFHPQASEVLVDYVNWQLSMLTQLASSIERHDRDPVLQAIRRDVYLHPTLRDAYVTDMPAWVLGAGADLIHHEGATRALRHPSPEVGLQSCRLVVEAPRALQTRSLTRITLVLTDLEATAADARATRDQQAA